jgi:translation initiation factor IF-1
LNKIKKDCLKLKGEVKEALPGCKFIVNVKEPMDINVVCSLSGKMRQNGIRIIENDIVEIEVSVYDLSNGRIVWRIK